MRCLLFIIFFYSTFEAFTQPGFNRSYDLNGLSVSFGSLELSNDTIILYGTLYGAGTTTFGMLSARVDSSGNLIDYHVYYDSLEDNFTLVYPNSFIRLSDGSGYAGVGQLFSRRNGYLARFDASGSLLYFKEFADSTSGVDFFYQVKELPDGFLIGGHKDRWVGELDVFLIKTDKEGNKLWERNYGKLNRNDLFGNVYISNSNEYVIGCATTILQNVPYSQTKNTSRIIGVDSLGAIKWEWETAPSLEELGVGNLQKTQQGNWFYKSACGWYHDSLNYISRRPKIVIRDTNFNLIRADTFGLEGSNTQYFANVIPLSDHGWLAVGSIPAAYETEPLIGYNSLDGWMMRFDSSANPVWSWTDTAFWSTQSGSRNFLNDAVELPSGSIVACGYSRTYDPVVKDWGWLVKISPDGCVDVLSCATIGVEAPLPPSWKETVRLYPNPTSSVLHIESSETDVWDHVEVIDMMGRVLQSYQQFTENRIDLSRLEDGMYWVRLVKEGKMVTRKVIKTGI